MTTQIAHHARLTGQVQGGSVRVWTQQETRKRGPAAAKIQDVTLTRVAPPERPDFDILR